jgi:hypothetical protein
MQVRPTGIGGVWVFGVVMASLEGACIFAYGIMLVQMKTIFYRIPIKGAQ